MALAPGSKTPAIDDIVRGGSEDFIATFLAIESDMATDAATDAAAEEPYTKLIKSYLESCKANVRLLERAFQIFIATMETNDFKKIQDAFVQLHTIYGELSLLGKEIQDRATKDKQPKTVAFSREAVNTVNNILKKYQPLVAALQQCLLEEEIFYAMVKRSKAESDTNGDYDKVFEAYKAFFIPFIEDVKREITICSSLMAIDPSKKETIKAEQTAFEAKRRTYITCLRLTLVRMNEYRRNYLKDKNSSARAASIDDLELLKSAWKEQKEALSSAVRLKAKIRAEESKLVGVALSADEIMRDCYQNDMLRYADLFLNCLQIPDLRDALIEFDRLKDEPTLTELMLFDADFRLLVIRTGEFLRKDHTATITSPITMRHARAAPNPFTTPLGENPADPGRLLRTWSGGAPRSVTNPTTRTRGMTVGSDAASFLGITRRLFDSTATHTTDSSPAGGAGGAGGGT